MNKKLTFNYSLEMMALLVAIAGGIGVMYTFAIGKHYIIPTIILTDSVFILNLAYFGFRDKAWAKYLLFWIFALTCCHTFFALFVAEVPRQALGELFLPIYAMVCISTGLLSLHYARVNRLYRRVQVLD